MKLEAKYCPTQYRVEIFKFNETNLMYNNFATWSFSSICKRDMFKLFRSYQKTPGELAYEYRVQLISHSKTEENYKILVRKYVDYIKSPEQPWLSSYQRQLKRELFSLPRLKSSLDRLIKLPTSSGKAV